MCLLTCIISVSDVQRHSPIVSICKCDFYPRNAVLSRYLLLLSSCVCPSVCLSVTRRYCVSKRLNIESRKQHYVIACRNPSFLTPIVVNGRPPHPLKFALKVTHPLSNTTISTNIRSQRLNRESWRKSSNGTNRKSTTRFPTSHKVTVYVTPKSHKGWHKTQFCCFC